MDIPAWFGTKISQVRILPLRQFSRLVVPEKERGSGRVNLQRDLQRLQHKSHLGLLKTVTM